MARGGKRPSAGRPTKPLVDKILEGNPGKRPLKEIDFKGCDKEQALPAPPEDLSERGLAPKNWLSKADYSGAH